MLFSLLSLVASCNVAQSQGDTDVYVFATDSLQRGYYNRPYERYEAEPAYCSTTGSFLEATDDQRELQSEATHQQAVQLVKPNDYVAWCVNNPGDGVTIRFSLPDSHDGLGTKGTVHFYAGEEKVGELTLDSYWAWQYCTGTYPVNTPIANCVIRMRFDEMHVRLSRPVAQGEELRVVKADDNTTPYTIDFVELEMVPEPVTFESIEGDKVQYNGGSLQDFVSNNRGKIIYIPAGKWEVAKRIHINYDNTHLVGAGMWYTEIFFSAPSDNNATYSQRGFETNRSNIRIEGMYINTINNQRYYNNDSSKQVGKTFMGSWGKNSVIRNCWTEHFECGAWIADYSATGSENLLVEHCRFRNHYADGFNASHASIGHTIQYCSFRNNGDDDMASWTTARMCKNVTYAYCTAENNWRASSLGFFGGTNHYAHHIAIFDPLECGVRLNADFEGKGFGDEGMIRLHDITIVHAGCKRGTKGTSGDFWGNMQGAFNIGPTGRYVVKNIQVENVDVLDSRQHAFYIAAGANPIENLVLKSIHVQKAATAFYFANAKGNATYCDLHCQDVEKEIGSYQANFWNWVPAADCGGTDVEETIVPSLSNEQTAYDIIGRPVANMQTAAPGIYIVGSEQHAIKVMKP